MGTLLRECARGLLESTPQIMQSIRTEMRRRGAHEISVPQFRALAFVDRQPDRSLSDLAEHLGLTLPSVSKLIDGLVKQNLIVRRESRVDRRRLTLALTGRGEELLRAARDAAQAHLTELLGRLPDDDLQILCRATEVLRSLFVPAAVK